MCLYLDLAVRFYNQAILLEHQSLVWLATVVVAFRLGLCLAVQCLAFYSPIGRSVWVSAWVAGIP
jgi:hypothetical protein